MPTEMGKLFGLDAFNGVEELKRQAEYTAKHVAGLKRLTSKERVGLLKYYRAHMGRVKVLLDAEIAKCNDDNKIDSLEMAKNVIDRQLELIEKIHEELDGQG